MRNKRLYGLGAVVASLTLIGTACAAPEDEGSGSGGDGGGEPTSVTLGWNQAFYSYNENSASGNAVANSTIKYLMNNNFWIVDQEGNLEANTDFGTYEQTSEDPLTVEYTVNDDTTWSDGVPVDSADILLDWAARSGQLNTFTPENAEDEPGEDQVYFSGSSIGLAKVSEVPEVSEDGKGATLVYDEPFADWQYDVSVNLPAHVVAMKALDIDDPQEAKDALVKAIQDNDEAALAPISRFWNTGFDYTEMPEDPALALSNGAYVLKDFQADQFLTLEKNPDFEGEKQGVFDTVTVRWEGDPLAQVQALQNGEIDMMSPQATTDLIQAAEDVENVNIITGEEGSYEHVDLVQRNNGPFDPRSYGGDAETAKAVRQAFLTAIPRQQIVERLVQPINPDSTVRNSFIIPTGLAGYDEIVAQNNSSEYAESDPAAAARILEEAGVETPIDVRMLFDSTNSRRQQQFELMRPALQEAGFTLNDVSNPNWGEELANAGDTYDASLFAWQSTTLAVSESAETFRSGGQNNFIGYSNEEVDDLFEQLSATTDTAEQLEIQTQIDRQLWDDAIGITIFQHPGANISNETRISGVEPGVLNPTMYYGFWNWQPGAE